VGIGPNDKGGKECRHVIRHALLPLALRSDQVRTLAAHFRTSRPLEQFDQHGQLSAESEMELRSPNAEPAVGSHLPKIAGRIQEPTSLQVSP
jgi:hypothetical protein